MYSQYIPHFPTLWLTKDERSLLYKYFILNPSLCCISSIVSSHLQILYIVQKSADLGKGHVLVGSSAAPAAAVLLPGRGWSGGSSCWEWALLAKGPGHSRGLNSESGNLCLCAQPLTWVRTRE